MKYLNRNDIVYWSDQAVSGYDFHYDGSDKLITYELRLPSASVDQAEDGLEDVCGSNWKDAGDPNDEIQVATNDINACSVQRSDGAVEVYVTPAGANDNSD